MVIPKSVHRERMEEKLHSGTVCFGMDYRTETMDCTDSGHYKEIKFRLLEPCLLYTSVSGSYSLCHSRSPLNFFFHTYGGTAFLQPLIPFIIAQAPGKDNVISM